MRTHAALALLVDGFPLTFFVPLVIHALAGLTTVIMGIITFTAPKRPGRHHRWGGRYLWAYTVVFCTAFLLSIQHWPEDAYLFLLAVLGYSLALTGYAARRYRRQALLQQVLGEWWVVVHLVGMIGSYVVLLTAFYVDNAHLIPGLQALPTLTFWVAPTLIALPFLILSIARFAPHKSTRSAQATHLYKKNAQK